MLSKKVDQQQFGNEQSIVKKIFPETGVTFFYFLSLTN